MNKTLLLIALLICCDLCMYAQLSKEQRVQDSVIGWEARQRYDHYLKPPTTPAGKQKLAYVDKMVEWVTRSYTPVGSLGEYTRYINKMSYGLILATWSVGYDYMENGHFRPIPEENVPYYFAANKVYGAFDIDFLSKSGDLYFTMQPNSYAGNSTEKGKREGMNKSVDPNVSKYLVWINDWVTIYLAPGNKLPMIRVTRGELLDKAAASLDGVLADRKKDEHQRWQGNERGEADAVEYARKEIDKFRADIQKLKEKYSNSLNEPASVIDMQTNWRSFEYGTWDIFAGAPNSIYYPVYKLDTITREKMKGAQPLWIAVALPYATKSDGNAKYELYTAMTQNLNYDHIYHYFFDPEKVKGVAYTPANEAQLKQRLEGYRKKNNANNNAAADTKGWGANVYFQDDLSSSPEGGDPLNWWFNRSSEHDQVVKLAGQSGKWMKLAYNNISVPTLIKKPFPKNFTLEFDLITDDFAGRYGGGVLLYMSTNQALPSGGEQSSPRYASVEVSLGAGNETDYQAGSNFGGGVSLTLYKGPEPNKQNFKGGAYGKSGLVFTNKRNKLHAALQVNNGHIRLVVNGKELLASKDLLLAYGGQCVDCSIPSDLLFNYIYWKSNRSDAYSYIGNIRVMKD